MEISLSQGKNKNEVEHYGHTMLAVVFDRLLHFNQVNATINEFNMKDFEFLKDKIVPTSSRERRDFIVCFDSLNANNKNTNEIKKIALVMEFKCKDTIEQSLKEAKNDLIRKNTEIRNNVKDRYNFINDYEKIWVAAALGSSYIQGLILYKLERRNNQDELVEFMKWPKDLEANI